MILNTHVLLYIYTGCPRRNGHNFGSVPYVKIYRYNPKHLYPKLDGYGDNGQRKVWSSCGFHALYDWPCCVCHTAQVRPW